jgi:topoisomerase IA-like protein
MQGLVIKARSDINIKAGFYNCYVAPGRTKAQMPNEIQMTK